jgi:hypothetical protein
MPTHPISFGVTSMRELSVFGRITEELANCRLYMMKITEVETEGDPSLDQIVVYVEEPENNVPKRLEQLEISCFHYYMIPVYLNILRNNKESIESVVVLEDGIHGTFEELDWLNGRKIKPFFRVTRDKRANIQNLNTLRVFADQIFSTGLPVNDILFQRNEDEVVEDKFNIEFQLIFGENDTEMDVKMCYTSGIWSSLRQWFMNRPPKTRNITVEFGYCEDFQLSDFKEYDESLTRFFNEVLDSNCTVELHEFGFKINEKDMGEQMIPLLRRLFQKNYTRIELEPKAGFDDVYDFHINMYRPGSYIRRRQTYVLPADPLIMNVLKIFSEENTQYVDYFLTIIGNKSVSTVADEFNSLRQSCLFIDEIISMGLPVYDIVIQDDKVDDGNDSDLIKSRISLDPERTIFKIYAPRVPECESRFLKWILKRQHQINEVHLQFTRSQMFDVISRIDFSNDFELLLHSILNNKSIRKIELKPARLSISSEDDMKRMIRILQGLLDKGSTFIQFESRIAEGYYDFSFGYRETPTYVVCNKSIVIATFIEFLKHRMRNPKYVFTISELAGGPITQAEANERLKNQVIGLNVKQLVPVDRPLNSGKINSVFTYINRARRSFVLDRSDLYLEYDKRIKSNYARNMIALMYGVRGHRSVSPLRVLPFEMMRKLAGFLDRVFFFKQGLALFELKDNGGNPQRVYLFPLKQAESEYHPLSSEPVENFDLQPFTPAPSTLPTNPNGGA